jgi:hypothetical protein
VTDVIASTVRLLRRRLAWARGERAGTVSDIPVSTRAADSLAGASRASLQGDERAPDRGFVCLPLTDVAKSIDLACVFSVNAMVFKCESEDQRAVEAADQLSALMQDLIDVAEGIDRISQRALCRHVYGIVLELRRLGFAVSVGQGRLDVRGSGAPFSAALKSWQVLCVVLRDARKAMPVALIPTPMTIA